MVSKAKSDAAAAADLLLEEEKKSQSKKKKNKSKKKNSTSMSNPHNKTVEHETPVTVEAESTSPSLKIVEGDSTEPEDTLANGKGRLEIPSNTVNQEEDIQNIPGECLLPKHVDTALIETAARDNLALDMTLKLIQKQQKTEGRSHSQKRKRNRSKKKTSTSMASPLNKTVEHIHSVNVKTNIISLSLKTVAEGSLELEDTLASERGRLEILSRTESQDQAIKDDPDMQNMLGEDSESEVLESAHGEAAVRCNSVVDMTLKRSTRRVPPTTAQETTWTPPTEPYLKCNIGCMWVNRNENCGAALLLRDHMGNTLLHGRRSYSNVPSQFEAQCEAYYGRWRA